MFLTIEQDGINRGDWSKSYTFLHLATITEVKVTDGRFNGIVEVMDLNTGVRRSIESAPIRIIQPFFGDGYGAYGVPSKNDLVVLGFLTENVATIIGYLPFNYFLQTGTSTTFTEMRELTSGEYCIRSKGGAEIFWDIDGNTVINSGTKGCARKDDEIKSTSSEDSTYWSWISELVTQLTNWVNRANSGATPDPTLALEITTWLNSHPTPSSLTGKITKASSTVKVGGNSE